MVKKLLFIAALLFLVSPPARAQADTSSYTTKDNVGFTGEWTTPSSSTPPPSTTIPPVSQPGGQSVLPKTGDSEVISNATSLVGLSALALAAFAAKKLKEG